MLCVEPKFNVELEEVFKEPTEEFHQLRLPLDPCGHVGEAIHNKEEETSER